MSLNSELYIHPSDKAALSALKAIPGFAQVSKAFMKVWNEKQFKIANMSTNLKISEQQMAKYYNMLPPICERLGIDVPEMYVELDVRPNAYTYGDTNPFIVLTSGLFETIPEELIPTVIAHECGHIACHHTLYRTMGSFILNGTDMFTSGLGNIALYPIQLAFAYWMRCSELSADRAAVIWDESADNTIEMCMRFAGYDKDIMADANVDLFVEQAKEYRELVNGNAVNKAIEFIMFRNNDHPLNAVRAYEAKEWSKTDRFKTILNYIDSPDANHLPVRINPSKFIGKSLENVEDDLIKLGFINITEERIIETDTKKKQKPLSIQQIIIDDKVDNPEDFYQRTSSIKLVYYKPKTDEEIAAEHPFEVRMIHNSKFYQNKNVDEVEGYLSSLGFVNIERKEMAIPKLGVLVKPDNVAKILVSGNDHFDVGDWYPPDVDIMLYYYVQV